jgi:hypothetical protein
MLVSRSGAAMSDILGVGLTHYPPLLGTDADVFNSNKVFAVYPVVTG